MNEDIQLFALGASREFGEKVGRELGLSLAAHEERLFEDGEHKARPTESVRGKDVYVLHSLYGEPGESVNDKLCRLLFFLGAVRDAGAERITAVLPYLCYARKDRKSKARDPVTTRYVAQLFEAVHVDRVVTLDVHNLAAFQNAFRCRTEHLEARVLFIEHFAHKLKNQEVAIVSPDVGGVKRANAFRESLSERLGRDVSGGFMEKKRSEGVVSGDIFVGTVENRVVLVVDDLISTGTTMARAARAAREHGARSVAAVATHGIFIDADKNLRDFDEVVVTDTIPPFRLDESTARDKLRMIGAASLFAGAIRRIHRGGSIVELIDQPG